MVSLFPMFSWELRCCYVFCALFEASLLCFRSAPFAIRQTCTLFAARCFPLLFGCLLGGPLFFKPPRVFVR